MKNLKDEIKFPCGLSMKNRFMLAPLTNTQSHEDGVLSDDESIKFYGLPTTIPSDRHRWFFNNNDSLKFITTNAEKNNFELIHTDYSNKNKPIGGKTVKGFFSRLLLRLIFRKDILDLELNSGARWFVLRRK